ncbi:MAG: hypothetical protein ABS36_04640 [Acidobacteria bacterium SCN 69-37]|nr:MAG: hypothetical protein ABS36_04640 [Acidobacteria bacterium SCN 69-37]
MSTRIVIIGAGGQGLVVADILIAARMREPIEVVGLLDDDPTRTGQRVLGIPILGGIGSLPDVPHDAVVVAIGDNARREQITRDLEYRGVRLHIARHPFTSFASDVAAGPGCMISAGAVVTPGARLGPGVILNTRASVDHQSVVAAFAHVSAGATVGADVSIGERTLIGLGASVMSGRRIGADTIVGAGAVVVHDLPDGVVAVGVPARILRRVGQAG